MVKVKLVQILNRPEAPFCLWGLDENGRLWAWNGRDWTLESEGPWK